MLNIMIYKINFQGVGSQTGYKIYVALDTGCLCEFRIIMATTSQNIAILRHKKLSVNTERSIVLKSETIYCVAYSETKQELWTGINGYIDIVSCSHFNVKERIHLTTLLRMCQIHPRLCVSQMVCSGSQMFCMLAYSPYILEFDAHTYTCVTLLGLGCEHVIAKLVATEMKFTRNDHDAYRGITTEQYLSDDTDDSDADSGDKAEEAGNNYCKQPSYSRNIKQSRETWSTGASAELNSENSDQPPQVPPRKTAIRLPGINEVSPPTRPCTMAPIILPKPNISQHLSKPPSLPPKGMTLQPDINRPSRKKIEKQRSLTLPNIPQHSGHDIELTSVLIVKNSLWVGRSCGDICIVNTHRPPMSTAPNRFGKVLADMYSLNNRNQGGKTVESVRLVKTGKHIASAYTLNDGIHATVQIAFWDSYGVEDVERVEGYLEHILAAEKLLLCGS